ncbi:MAG: hypothetical protein J6C37_12335 [Roseburia sp.]|nr:hypothetical protein [Roseburia sp.]
MINYQVTFDKENNRFLVEGPFAENAIPIEIPMDNPQRKHFIDLFLHKADIDRGIDYLQRICATNDTTLNEALFVAGLNNCMKCFKYSKSRTKLDKVEVFSGNQRLYDNFIMFETMRDKHYDHDENGMLQATAFLLVCSDGERLFGGTPSVVWRRAKLDYCLVGQMLQEVMLFVQQHLCQKIDTVGKMIERAYVNLPRETLLELQTAHINALSFNSR